MFSNLTSYLWGSAEEAAPEAPEAAAAPQQQQLIISSSSSAPQPRGRGPLPDSREERSAADDEEDWVLVGGASGTRGHAPTLGSLGDAVPRPVTGSAGSSAQSSDEEDEEEDEDEDEEDEEMDSLEDARQMAFVAAREAIAKTSRDVVALMNSTRPARTKKLAAVAGTMALPDVQKPK